MTLNEAMAELQRVYYNEPEENLPAAIENLLVAYVDDRDTAAAQRAALNRCSVCGVTVDGTPDGAGLVRPKGYAEWFCWQHYPDRTVAAPRADQEGC